MPTETSSTKRRYEKRARAAQEEETRQRIIDAAIGLHGTVGPARTTVSAIAERAGVERHTFYAHFPDERSLFRACSLHWRALHPRPDPGRWLELDVPEQRLRGMLSDLYAWYEEVESDIAVFRRDAQVHELNAAVIAGYDRELAGLADGLAREWPRRKAVRAAIGHALAFETWRSLVRTEGLGRKQAVDAMLRLVASS